MIINPFTSKTYTTIWLKHFGGKKDAYSFESINDLKFIADDKFPCYVNAGKNMTNGISYTLNPDANDFKNKVFLIHDVPDYFPSSYDPPKDLKTIQVQQYKGVYTDFSDLKSLDEVLAKCFSSKSRSRFRGRVRQIESSFNISQKVYFGAISREDYEREMNALKNLIIKRFDELNIHNTVIPVWDFYYEAVYPLILEKKVVFNVIYNDDEPIAMSVNFVYDDIVAISIRSFSVDYYKYNIGNYEIYRLIDWCIQNNFRILDFSKGEGGYKQRWTTNTYNFNCHILYDSSSIKARVSAKMIKNTFAFKQYLRDKGINLLYSKAVFKLKNLRKK
jgi:CelD/BcsL family acetyltransferase involved in cellulose biosynthesis